MIATETIVLYKEPNLFLAQVEPGEKYYIPANVFVFVGDYEAFRNEFGEEEQPENL